MANIKQLFAIRILISLAAVASVGMYLSILLAILDIGPHIMGGEHVTRSEWLHIAAPLFAVIGVLMGFISYGFAMQKPWSRHLVIAMFSLIIVYASILGPLNLIHQAIMWQSSTLRCLVPHLFGIFILNQTSLSSFGSHHRRLAQTPYTFICAIK